MKTAGMLGLVALLLLGCAGKPLRHEVAHEMILPEGAERTVEQERQQFLMAVPIAQPMPVWPEGVVSPAAQLPVCVEFVISEDGSVHSQRLLEGVADCVVASQPGITPFVDTALAAVAQWQFFGAGMCTWQREEAECSDGRAQVAPLAIRLSYRFRFHAGRAVAMQRR